MIDHTNQANRKKEKFFGRRKGRPLSADTLNLINTVLPKLKVSLNDQGGIVKPSDLFDATIDAYALEIGFGGGEHLAAQALENPHTGFIGAEVFLNGVASLLQHVHQNDISNIRIFPEDIRPLLEIIEPCSLNQIFVLFPDPWPKARHHKRRIIQKERIDLFAKVLKKDGELCLATDVPDYLSWMHTIMSASPSFKLKHSYTSETKPSTWIETKYEQKAREQGRSSTYLIYQKLS